MYRCATADTEAEAWDLGRKLLARTDTERLCHVEPTRQTLGAFLDGWLPRKRAEGLKEKTLFEYERVIRQSIIPSLGDIPLQELAPAAIQKWQDALAPTPESKGAAQSALAYRTLRSALSDAERLGLISVNVARRARPARRTSRKRAGFSLQEAWGSHDGIPR